MTDPKRPSKRFPPLRRRAIIRKAATRVVRRGEFTGSDGAPFAVDIGSRFSGGGLNYQVVELLEGGAYRLRCESAGTQGNAWFGTLLPIDYVQELAVDVTFFLTLEDGVGWDNVRSSVAGAIADYFSELIGGWEEAATLTVRLSQIEARVLRVAGVLDVTNTALNGTTANLPLEGRQIPVLRGVINAAA